ncbi:glycoside hydrolase family 65 protein [Pseudonocardia zijingensis]|uniref:Trehalose 6-phosphate phosphorylase n=1 Tax=Pseudonocardia zijingensis TaxID=153376 RepID=A0ABP3ZLW4_9PSEU
MSDPADLSRPPGGGGPTADTWTLEFDILDPAGEGRREALCTLGNGRFATRGAAPESRADDVHRPGTYAAGVYNRLRDEIAGRVVENESMVNLPNWLDLRFGVGDGWTDLSAVRVLEHRWALDLRRGVLNRKLRFVDAAGRTTAVRQRRLVCMAQPQLAGLHTVVTAEDWSGTLRVASGIDGAVTNSGVARYAGLAGDHLDVVTTAEPAPRTLLLMARTNQSEVRIAEAARTRVRATGAPDPEPRLVRDGERISHEFEVAVRAGEAVSVEKVVALQTSRDPAISEPALAATEQVAAVPGFDDLLTRHELAWHQLWRRFRVQLDDLSGAARRTTDELLRTVRLSVFHVLQTVSPHNVDLDAGIPARGLHGEAYRGHVFWDELFVLPLLTLRLPGLARALLRYRTRRLDAARRAAREAGYPGAMYPWQSGSDGREETQRVHLNPRSGRWLPDTSHLQRHVGLAVAYDIWQYHQATGDVEFLADHGAETLLEIARFFAGVTTYDPSRDRFRIRGVMGPDEYSTRYPGAAEPGIDDNAYTNVMTVWLLLRAQEVLDVLPPTRRAELVERLGLRPEELLHWRDISRRMYVPIAPDGIISQFEGYRDLPELDWDGYRRRYGDIQRLDRILEAEGRSVDDYQASKQADVLMLFYLLSADELRELLGRLGYALPPEAIPRTIEYYLARTAHGSTLSALVHAWVLARANRAQALEHFERAVVSDVADIQGGTTAEGVHLGAMAGSVDLLQRCFAGLETRRDALWFNPHWPIALGRLEFTVEYRGRPITVGVIGREVTVSAGSGAGAPVRVGCGEQVCELRPGETARFMAVGVPLAGPPVETEPAAR